jgi:acetyltransferase-like isoleucine patch superfamily enzyme
MKRAWLELSVLKAVDVRIRQRGAQVVPFRRARMRLLGVVVGGGRLEVGRRWPDGYFSTTEFIVQAGGRCNVEGDFRFFTGSSVVVAPGAQLNLGSGYLSNGTSIACFASVTIGQDAAIGPEVSIRDSDSHTISGSSRPPTQPIRIGDHVWIGARATILKGVTIGDGAIVAAGAIVTKDVEPGTLVAGAPAKFVRHSTWAHDLTE